MPLSPTATGMVTASGNQLVHHQQQIQQQQQYNNDMLGHDPNMFNQQQQLQQQQQQTAATGKPAGTITGMLADFSRALGKKTKSCLNILLLWENGVFFLRRASVRESYK